MMLPTCKVIAEPCIRNDNLVRDQLGRHSPSRRENHGGHQLRARINLRLISRWPGDVVSIGESGTAVSGTYPLVKQGDICRASVKHPSGASCMLSALAIRNDTYAFGKIWNTFSVFLHCLDRHCQWLGS